MKEILLSQGKTTIVDDDMEEYLNQWKWYYNKGYVVRHVWMGGKRILLLMHRVVANTPEGMDTDHINHNKCDNRRSNLRVCTKSQNEANKPKNRANTSGYKGVYWHKPTQKWRAHIRFHSKRINIGNFTFIEDAVNAYNKKAEELFGEFAFVDGD